MSIRLIGITHQYRRSAPVLRGVTMEFDAGDSVAIFGPSGSGKTTLLSILGGLLRPSSGEVWVDGVELHGEPNRIASWVFQTINLVPHRTALENVRLGLFAQGRYGRDLNERAVAMLDRVGVGQMAHERAMRLSGGEAQRVGIARALVGEPRLVIADEPTGQLDQATSAEIGSLLVTERDAGTMLIVATHDAALARMCERRYRLVEGHLNEA